MTSGTFSLRMPASTASVVGLAMTASTLVGFPAVVTRQAERPEIVEPVHYTARPVSLNVEVRHFAGVVPQIDSSAALEEALMRIEAMAALEDGWLGEDSVAPTTAVLGWTRELVTGVDRLPLNFAPAPLPDGGVRFEWRTAAADHVAEIEPSGSMYLCVLAAEGEDVDVEYDHFDADVIRQFVRDGSL